MTTKYIVSKHASGIDGLCTYRGITIKRNDIRGVWWKYTATCSSMCTGTHVKFHTITRKQLLVQIDGFLDRK